MTKPNFLTPIDEALITAIQARGLATALDEIIKDIGLNEPIPEKRLDSLLAINNALLEACENTAGKLNAVTAPSLRETTTEGAIQ